MTTKTTLKMVPIEQLVAREENLRTDVNGDDLVESMQQIGVIAPLNVSHVKGEYFVNAGHRRLDAARKAGLTEVPVLVSTLDEKEITAVMLVENLMREDLDPVEEAFGFLRLNDLGWQQKEIAEKTGFSPAVISRRIKITKLPDEILVRVRDGQLSLDLAEALVPLAAIDPDEAIKMSTNGWFNEHNVEAQVKRLKNEATITKMAGKLDRLEIPYIPFEQTSSFTDNIVADDDGVLVKYQIEFNPDDAKENPGRPTTVVDAPLDLQKVADDKKIHGLTVRAIGGVPQYVPVTRIEVAPSDPDAPERTPDEHKAEAERAARKLALAKGRHDQEQLELLVAGKITKTQAVEWALRAFVATAGLETKKKAARLLQLDPDETTVDLGEGKTRTEKNWLAPFNRAYDEASGAQLTRIYVALILADFPYSGMGEIQADIKAELGFEEFVPEAS